MLRIHIALDVSNLSKAVDFYEHFLGTPPLRQIGGYAQFLVDAPPLNLALTENAQSHVLPGHFGIEVAELGQVASTLARIQAAELDTELETHSLCCHARQEKFWVHDPDGHRWEVFWVQERFMTESQSTDRDLGCCHA